MLVGQSGLDQSRGQLYLSVRPPVNIPLCGRPEALATLEAGEGLRAAVHPLVNCLGGQQVAREGELGRTTMRF